MDILEIKGFFRHYLRWIFDIFFPRSYSAKHRSFDFSKIKIAQFPELLKSLPKSNSPHPKITSCLSYKNTIVRNLVLNIKTKKDRHYLLFAGFVMSEKLKILQQNRSHPLWHSEKIILIPIPISQRRRRERGYNQCELIAQQIQFFMAKNCTIEIKTDLLFRTRQKGNAKKQAFKNRIERISGIKDAFYANKKLIQKIPELKNHQLIIIDDVLTTGSTLNAALMTLQNAGCKNVCSLTLSH